MEEGPSKRVVVIGAQRDAYRYLRAAAIAGYQPAEQQMLTKACFLVAINPHTHHDQNALSIALTLGRRVAVIAAANPDAIDLACELYSDLSEFQQAMILQAEAEKVAVIV